MQYLPLTLETPAQNLALDEALLDACEAGETTDEILRAWESPQHCVVLGRSTDAQLEVNLAACRQDGVTVLRRPSGGGAVVAGPGCLMYAVVLNLESRPHLRAVDLAHQFVLQCMAELLQPVAPRVVTAGISDLALPEPSGNESAKSPSPLVKFSGNALRLKRNHLLYHGTLLYNFDLKRIGRVLATPTREPDYRENRPHRDFVANLPTTQDRLTQALVDGWQADRRLNSWPQARVSQIVERKYRSDPKWNIYSPAS